MLYVYEAEKTGQNLMDQPGTKSNPDELECLRCGFRWISRHRFNLPDRCANPHCQSYFWDKPRHNRKEGK